jgi:hypothetical protein
LYEHLFLSNPLDPNIFFFDDSSSHEVISFDNNDPTKEATAAILSDNSQANLYDINPPLDQPVTNMLFLSTFYLSSIIFINSLNYPISSMFFFIAYPQQPPPFHDSPLDACIPGYGTKSGSFPPLGNIIMYPAFDPSMCKLVTNAV